MPAFIQEKEFADGIDKPLTEEVRLHLRKEFSGDMIPSITVLKTKTDGSYVYLLEEKKRSNDSGSKAEFTYHIKDGLIITMWCGPIL